MISNLIERYPSLAACREDIKAATEALVGCFRSGGKLLLVGNGGSAADCDHIVGELMKGFMLKRPLDPELKGGMRARCPSIEDSLIDSLQGGLPAISLPSISALNTAFANDVSPELVYAQSVLALGREGDVLIAISTSGNAENVLYAAKVARALGLCVVGLSGETGGKLKALTDVCITVPERETYKVQELHLPIYHCICAEIERHFFTV